MTHILAETTWWLLVTQINAAAWLSISGLVLAYWMFFDAIRGLFR